MILAIIQSRSGSARLPRKSLMEVPQNSGISMIERVIRRVQKCYYIDNIVLTTPDEELVEIAKKCGIKWLHYTGQRDVLREFYEAAQSMSPDTIVRITGDCCLIDPDIIDNVILNYITNKDTVDYVYNHNDDDGGIGEGQDVEVFSFDALNRAFNEATSERDREHVTSYFRSGKFATLQSPAYEWEGHSVNTLEEYEHICELARKYDAQNIL